MTIPNCDTVCRVIEAVAGRSAGNVCRVICPRNRNPASLLMELIEQGLIEAGQLLQILQRLLAEGLIAFLEFQRLVEKFVRDGIIALCGGDLRRLCISNSGEFACCNRGQPCTNGTCQCPPNQVRCGNACMERCPSNEVRDPNRNCQCVCSSGLRRCAGRCMRCPRGQSLDLETCECRCGQGFERCGEECVPSCPTGLAYDAETCECLCPAGATGCCGSDEECGDSNVCTQDRCDLATNRCVNQPADGCCRQDSECTTANPCTRDTCVQATNTCDHAQIAGCCRNDGECGACERCSDQRTCVADRAKDTTSCTVSDATGACCNGTCKVCAAGQTLDVDTCGCTGGGGETCVCTKKGLDERCERAVECCSGACGDPFFDGINYCYEFDHELYCADAGTFCSNDADGANHCCGGVCTDRICQDFICHEAGDPGCRFNQECCGSAVCASSGCCVLRGDRCTASSECCSGSCENFYDDGNRYCACGPIGTPAREAASAVAKPAARRASAPARRPEHGNLPCRVDADCCGGRCQIGFQAPDDGAEGICCRFAGVDCQFDHECCSRSCNVDLSTCN